MIKKGSNGKMRRAMKQALLVISLLVMLVSGCDVLDAGDETPVPPEQYFGKGAATLATVSPTVSNYGRDELDDLVNPEATQTAMATPTLSPALPAEVTLTPTPYVFATLCGPCVPTEIPDFDYIAQFQEFAIILEAKVEKYIYFPATVYHRVNEYEVIALWGEGQDTSQAVWIQLQKDGSQRTDGLAPGQKILGYGQINLEMACTDDVSDVNICFPVVAGSSILIR